MKIEINAMKRDNKNIISQREYLENKCITLDNNYKVNCINYSYF